MRFSERSPRGRRRGALAALLGGALLALTIPGAAEPAVFQAPDVKVAMVGKIAEFIRWPADAGLNAADRPIELVILGDTPLREKLRSYYEGVNIAGHRVWVRFAKEPKGIGPAHILFLGEPFSNRPESVLNILGSAPVLTMGDTKGLACRGVVVNLIERESRIGFAISRRALRQHRLEASYRLMSLARLVDEPCTEED